MWYVWGLYSNLKIFSEYVFSICVKNVFCTSLSYHHYHHPDHMHFPDRHHHCLLGQSWHWIGSCQEYRQFLCKMKWRERNTSNNTCPCPCPRALPQSVTTWNSNNNYLSMRAPCMLATRVVLYSISTDTDTAPYSKHKVDFDIFHAGCTLIWSRDCCALFPKKNFDVPHIGFTSICLLDWKYMYIYWKYTHLLRKS